MLPEATHAPPPLAAGWRRLEGCRLDKAILPLVLLHPQHGVVLLGGPPEAEMLLRRRLELARFSGIFHGYLPVLQLPAGAAVPLAAFRALPPLSVPGGDAWVGAVERALTRDPPPAPPARLGIIARYRRRRRRLALLGGIGLSAGGAVGALAVAISLLPAPPASLPQVSHPVQTRPAQAAAAARAGRDVALPKADSEDRGRTVPAAGQPGPAPSPSAAPDIAAAPAWPPPRLAVAMPGPPPPPARPGHAEAMPPPPLPPAPPQPTMLALQPGAPPDVQPPAAPIAAEVPARTASELLATGTAGARAASPSPTVSQLAEHPTAAVANSIAEPSVAQLRCRRIVQRAQIGEMVRDADMRFLQRGCSAQGGPG